MKILRHLMAFATRIVHRVKHRKLFRLVHARQERKSLELARRMERLRLGVRAPAVEVDSR